MNCSTKSAPLRARPKSAFKRSKNTAPLAVLTSCSKSGETIAPDKRNCSAMKCCRTSESKRISSGLRALRAVDVRLQSSNFLHNILPSVLLSNAPHNNNRHFKAVWPGFVGEKDPYKK